MEFHERVVPLPTLPPIFRCHPCSLSLVLFFPYVLSLNSFCTRPIWKEFDEECLSAVKLQHCGFVISDLSSGHETDFIFLPALTGLGFAASESKFSSPSLVSHHNDNY